MLLWVIFALMTSVVLIAVLAPLSRPATRADDADEGALEVYRDQLAEVEAERARGLVETAEAEAARVEISRRLLASVGTPGSAAGAATRMPGDRVSLAIAAAVLVTLSSMALYLAYGQPNMPGFPIAERGSGSLADAPLGQMIAKVEARLRAEPRDGDGWSVIAPVYFKLGRYKDAANAYAHAAELKGENVERLAGFADSTVRAADGIVTEDARIAFQKILKLAPGQPQARFWLALAREQDGQVKEALAEYKAIVAAGPADASWRPGVEQHIAEVSRRLGGAQNEQKETPRGPTAQDMAAAQQLTEEQRSQMIAGMVDGLARRLERDGKDLAGWVRLVNAYAVLGRDGDARAALANARKQLGSDDKAMAELAALAQRLGFGS
jgi:cytochrome c-type biogenesis protein CcmH